MTSKILKLIQEDPDLKFIKPENVHNMEGAIFKWAMENQHNYKDQKRKNEKIIID